MEIALCRSELQQRTSDNPKVMQMFDETVSLWHRCDREQKGQFKLAVLLKAVAFAAAKHEGGTRKDAAATPYIVHPIGVARSLWEEGGIRSVNVLVAALLHDTLEDTDTTPEEIESLFGKRVRKTVEELSNDPNLSRDENKQRQVDHAPTMTLNAQLVKLADRLYNIRDLRNPPPKWSQAQVRDYLGWGEKLLMVLKGTNSHLEELLEAEIKSQLQNIHD
ncbi:MAG: HD domain-containing protein [Parachlamydia sp.]|nr:HD domain-containing protein [Parachlamydia sp.]